MTTTDRPRPRQCFMILEGQRDEHGYIPSLVTEGEWGHSPLRGDPKQLQAPWYWGTSYDDAKRVCDDKNRKLGLSAEDVAVIVASSMAQR